MKIIESPREGLQGIEKRIPAPEKARFINALLRVGFDTVEAGSIVSPRVVPQMADSLEVLKMLDLSSTSSNLMFLALNRKGADILAGYDEITHISYPFSFTPTFLGLNVRSTVNDVFDTTAYIVNRCEQAGKTAVIYISYAFGNPYGDPWSLDLLAEWAEKLDGIGARIVPMSNVSTEISPEMIRDAFSMLVPAFPEIEFGLHLHTASHDWSPKLDAAWEKGVRRFDCVIDGHGGCPMSGKEMMGNLATQNLRDFFARKGVPDGIDGEAFRVAMEVAAETYSNNN